ncbi:glycosyltransferase family 1 protein, partial [Suhomyces tanzawaensis NRRL Y-17324]
TPFQQSVVQNLNPRLLRERFLIKFKEGQAKDDNEYNAKTESLRLRVANKLAKVFEIDDNDHFYDNFSAWLVNDVLLQGHLYLTRESVLFFAFLPKRYSMNLNQKTGGSYTTNDDSNLTIQSGSLGLKTAKYGETIFSSVLTHRYWAILRPQTLSIYSSSTELHFPRIVIDLKSCIRAEVVEKEKEPTQRNTLTRRNSIEGGSTPRVMTRSISPRIASPNGTDLNLSADDETYFSNMLSGEAMEPTEDNIESSSGVWFKLVTKSKTYRFHTDNLYLARQWCHNLTKIIFQLNNSNAGNEVLIKIPIENVINFNRMSLLSADELPKDQPDEEDLPMSFRMHFLKNHGNYEESVYDSKKSKKKLTQGASIGMEAMYFIFFDRGEEFYSKFTTLIEEHQERSKNKSETSLISKSLISKSLRFKDMAKKMVRKDSRDSRIREYPKSISTLRSSSSSGSIIDQFAPLNTHLKHPYDLPEEDDNDQSSSTLKLKNVNFPRPMSVSGLKNLKMTFETSQKDFEVAESRYEAIKDTGTKAKEQVLPGPLNLTDPSEYTEEDPKQTKLQSMKKSIKAFSNVSNMWSSNPSHYQAIDPNDPFYVKEENTREVSQQHFEKHFSLGPEVLLRASYYCHLQKSIPVYGKLYLSTEYLCFRSLLPGVSTKMILPLNHIENCLKEKGLKLTYSGLVLTINNYDELILEFSSHLSRDDCENMIFSQLILIHDGDNFSPSPHEWGKNYDLELSKKRQAVLTSETRGAFSNDTNKTLAALKIDNARLKMFEEKINAASGLDIPIILEDSPFYKTEIRPSTSFHFVLLTIGSRGDVQPYIALGKGLINEGHTVTIATHKEFEDWILKHGMKFKEIAGDPGALMSLMVTHGSMSVAFLKEASAKFRGWISQLLRSSWEACQGADILIESPSAMGGVHIAEALGIPYMRAFTMPWTRTRAYPHAFIVPDQKKGGSYNYLTHVMFETVFWKGISSQINNWRVRELDLPRTNLYRLQQSKIPFLYNVSPTIFPPSVDFPDWIRVTGYWFLDEGAGEDYDPPKELVEFLDSARKEQKKIIYIGFGSIVVNDAKSLTKAIAEAVVDADVRCILNKGWSDRMSKKDDSEPEIELPAEIYNSGAVPHDWLFARIDAAIHHGGSGTTGATLRAGLPTVIKPFFGDQFFYASRIEEVGVGVALRKLNAKSLGKAIHTVTTDLKMIEKSKKLSERINQENGVLTAVETIYSELEYARHLIMSKQKYNEHYKQHHPDFGSLGIQTPVVPEESESSEEDEDEEDEDEEDEDEEEDSDEN